MRMKTRIHQYLSRSGIFGRKEQIFQTIRDGRVKIGDRVVKNPNFQFDPVNEFLFLDDNLIKNSNKFIYIVINKPENYLSTKLTPDDYRRKKRSVIDLVRDKSLDKSMMNSLFCV